MFRSLTLDCPLVTADTGHGPSKEEEREREWRRPARRGSGPRYVELHTASAFSFLRGASLPEDLIDQAANAGLASIALTDINGVYGAPRFHSAAKKAGIRALVGAEVVLERSGQWAVGSGQDVETVSPLPVATGCRKKTGITGRGVRGEGKTKTRASSKEILRSAQDDKHPNPQPTTDNPQPSAHAPRLTLLVESQTGYRNLCRLLTAGALAHEKGQARYPLDVIAQYSEGIHCLSGGAEGLIANVLTHDGFDAAEQQLRRLTPIFPDRLHIELQRHHLRDQEHRNDALVRLARRLRLPLVATNGVRYANDADKALLDILTCIHHGTSVDKAGRLLDPNRERRIRTADEMTALFADLPEAIDATVDLSQRLDFTLSDLGYRFPDYPLPPGETVNSFLRQITWNGARARFRPLTAKAQAQIEKELAMIEKLDLGGYFLIVWEIVQFCLENRILVQGRGSAANSAVCYALSITAVDPVKMELLFERFLSEERGEWPDIDLDLPSGDQRERVIQHVYERYGRLGAAMTANVITYRERSAAREVGKALGFSPEQVDRFAKQIGRWSFGEIRESMTDLPSELQAAGLDSEDLRVRHLVHHWIRIQNLPRHLGQHSGGMVMAGGRLDEVVPLEPASMPGRVVVQWDKDDCADLGIIKVDLLGLGMLAAMEEAIPMIRTNEKVEIDLAHLPQDDPLVFQMMNKADTVGVFQVESRAQMASLPRNAPKTFYDLVVQVAIIRPGPIVGGMVHPFFDRRQGKRPVEYPHPSLEPILERTLGVPLFQEQLLRIAMVAAGFTGGEAEELRRAMGFKRSSERMAQIERKLRDGMTERAITGEAQEQIVKSITSFALYGFPESHAASFALIAYASAYLKARHPAAFYASLLNAWPMGFYHPATLVKDAQRHGVPMHPIDVTRSGWMCRWEDGGVRLGLRFVKGLREKTGRSIEEEQARRPFASVDDLARRCSLRDDQLTKLAHAGALASFGLLRRAALWQAALTAKDAGPLFEDRGAWAVGGGQEDGKKVASRQSSAVSKAGVRKSDPVILSEGGRRAGSEGSQVPAPVAGASYPEILRRATPAQDDKKPHSVRPTAHASPLPEMSPFDETLADYAAMDLTTGPHLVEHLREELTQQGIRSAADLEKMPNGTEVTTAGAIIVRQRPGTAKGFVFLTLEDETGMCQAIIRPDLFREHRSLIIGSTGIIVQGTLQKDSGQPSIRAEKFWKLSGLGNVQSHDFH